MTIDFSPFLVDGSMSLRTIGFIMLGIHWFTAACIFQLPETKGSHMGGSHEVGGGNHHGRIQVPDDSEHLDDDDFGEDNGTNGMLS